MQDRFLYCSRKSRADVVMLRSFFSSVTAALAALHRERAVATFLLLLAALTRYPRHRHCRGQQGRMGHYLQAARTTQSKYVYLVVWCLIRQLNQLGAHHQISRGIAGEGPWAWKFGDFFVYCVWRRYCFCVHFFFNCQVRVMFVPPSRSNGAPLTELVI